MDEVEEAWVGDQEAEVEGVIRTQGRGTRVDLLLSLSELDYRDVPVLAQEARGAEPAADTEASEGRACGGAGEEARTRAGVGVGADEEDRRPILEEVLGAGHPRTPRTVLRLREARRRAAEVGAEEEQLDLAATIARGRYRDCPVEEDEEGTEGEEGPTMAGAARDGRLTMRQRARGRRRARLEVAMGRNRARSASGGGMRRRAAARTRRRGR